MLKDHFITDYRVCEPYLAALRTGLLDDLRTGLLDLERAGDPDLLCKDNTLIMLSIQSCSIHYKQTKGWVPIVPLIKLLDLIYFVLQLQFNPY